jgi:ubiquitin thioesterase OTU1
MKLRLQYKPAGGQPIVRQVIEADEQATLGDLRLRVASTLDLGPEIAFALRQGFPPRLLEGSLDHALASLGVRTGTTLLVEPIDLDRPASQAVEASSFAQKKPLPAQREILVQDEPAPNDSDAPEIAVPGLGTLILRVQPDDNSCLFRALGYLCMRSIDAMQELRAIVAQTIQSDPDTYSDAVLGMSRNAYCAKMNRADTWGGEIEIQILSKHFGVQVANIDCKTGKVYRYGEDFDRIVFIVYSGIHYDALALSPFAYAPPDLDQTQFTKQEKPAVEKAAQALVTELRKLHYYTDTAGFTLRCLQCDTALKGEKEAQAHAKETNHTQFGEYR